MTPATERCTDLEIKTEYATYTARQWGNDSGKKVLALHGWLDNAATFDLLAPFLTELQLIALDFPGHGKSEHRPPGYRYHYLDYIADVITVVDQLGWDKFILLGHSLGAGVASITAGAFPERVHKLVMIEGIGPMIRPVEDAPRFLRESITQMVGMNGKQAPVYRNLEAAVSARMRSGKIARSSAAVLVQRAISQSESGITFRSDPRLRITSPSYLTNEQVAAFLSQIQAPSLFIQAKSGIFESRPQLETRCEHVKQLQRAILPGHHHLHLDDPEPVASLINRFLA